MHVGEKIATLQMMLGQCERLRQDRADIMTAVSMDRVRAIVVDLLNELDVEHFDAYPPAAWAGATRRLDS